jgi:hypothetical protein
MTARVEELLHGTTHRDIEMEQRTQEATVEPGAIVGQLRCGHGSEEICGIYEDESGIVSAWRRS